MPLSSKPSITTLLCNDSLVKGLNIFICFFFCFKNTVVCVASHSEEVSFHLNV